MEFTVISILFSRYDTNASASDSDEGSGDSDKEKTKKKKEKEIKPKKTKTVVGTEMTSSMSYWELVKCWFKV
jgi:hypothetical protein